MAKYSVFTTAEKWTIVAMVSYAAWFSTLSSFIYFPALHLLSEVFSVSVDKINLTITSYMAVATVAPTLVGDAADVLGRRPVYVITLSLYVVANIAIALSKSYSALVGLRVLQALAISGMLPIILLLGFGLPANLDVVRHLLRCLRSYHRCCLARREGFLRQCGVFCVSVTRFSNFSKLDERAHVGTLE